MTGGRVLKCNQPLDQPKNIANLASILYTINWYTLFGSHSYTVLHYYSQEWYTVYDLFGSHQAYSITYIILRTRFRYSYSITKIVLGKKKQYII